MAAKSSRKPAAPRETATNASDNSSSDAIVGIQFSLPHLLDLALGTPEVGAVNFNVLHNFLRVLLNLTNLEGIKVEYRGDEWHRLKNMAAVNKSEPSLYLHEYKIIQATGGDRHIAENSSNANVEPEGAELSNVAQPSSGSGTMRSSDTGQQVPGDSRSIHSTNFVEPVADGATTSALGFEKLEDSVHELQVDFRPAEEIANTPEMREGIRRSSLNPVSDMLHVENLTKRLDAAEQEIEKMTIMIQDFVKSDKAASVYDEADTRFVDATFMIQLSAIQERLAQLEEAKQTKNASINILEGSAGAKSRGVSAADDAESSSRKKSSARGSVRSYKGEDDGARIDALKNEMAIVRKELLELGAAVATAESVTGSATARRNEATASNNYEVATNDAMVTKCGKRVQNAHDTCQSWTREVMERIDVLEKDVGSLRENMQKNGSEFGSCRGINDLFTRIENIQAEVESVNQTANQLLNDKETREMDTSALVEQIQLLKTIKADKEDLEDALAEKADTQMVNRKVSYDQFDAVCDDLGQGLEEAISKLGQQEVEWQKALEDVQAEIEGRVDRVQISPLKEFVNCKLKSLQEKLKALLAMKEENEAAGTKRVLRDVQCLSCDKNVVMRRQENTLRHAQAMPCTRSMKPYLTYELDQIRRQQKRLPCSRNTLHFEAAISEKTRRMKPGREYALGRSARNHVCNRYCGGSHTVTTPEQRVPRMGHFFAQWGPDVIQLSEGFVRGTDGKMYHGRDMPGQPDVCCSSGQKAVTPSQSTTGRLSEASQPPARNPSSRRVTAASQRRSTMTRKSVSLVRAGHASMSIRSQPQLPAPPTLRTSAPPSQSDIHEEVDSSERKDDMEANEFLGDGRVTRYTLHRIQDMESSEIQEIESNASITHLPTDHSHHVVASYGE